KVFAPGEVQAGRGGSVDDHLRIDAIGHVGARPVSVLRVLDDAHAAAGLERFPYVAKHDHGLFERVERVDDEHRVQFAGRQIRILRLPEHRPYVLQLLTFDAPLDGLEHLRLDVFGVDDAVRADTAREANREPAAAGAEVGDARAFGDAQGVHDLFGFLPRIALGPFRSEEHTS